MNAAMKFEPLTVSVNADPPAVAEDGLRLLMVGPPWLIEKFTALDVPPPGLGLNTVTEAVPPEPMSEAEMLACN